MNHIITAVVAAAGLLVGCSGGSKSEPCKTCSPTTSEIAIKAQYHKLTPEEAKTMMTASSDYVLLDVRTQEEFDQSRIDGAKLIPDYELKDRAATDLPDKNALILVYCRSGRRSAEAANMLVDMGYTKIYDFGGIIDWPYATVSGEIK